MKYSLLIFLLVCAFISARADVTIQLRAIPATGAFLQADESPLPDGSLARVGFFDEAGLAGLDPNGLRSFATVDALFTEVVTFTSLSGNIQGNTNVSVTAAGGVDRRIYVWVFNGGNPESATQSGIFTDPSWTVPSDFGTLIMVSSMIDEADIVLGSMGSGNALLLEAVSSGPVGDGILDLLEAVDSGNGQYTSAWFGELTYPGNRWIYNPGKGFLYFAELSTSESVFLYSHSLESWIWTSRSVYPDIHVYGTAEWFRVYDAGADAYLFDYAAGEWQL